MMVDGDGDVCMIHIILFSTGVGSGIGGRPAGAPQSPLPPKKPHPKFFQII